VFLVRYLDQYTYDYHLSLHSTREAAEAAFGDLLRRYIVKDGEPMPPKSEWGSLDLCDANGENVSLYKIELDGATAEEITITIGQEEAA
jgi:hypothetical protein